MCRALSDARNAMTSATSELLPGLPPVMELGRLAR